MDLSLTRLYRMWTYFRLGYQLYIATPVNILNFLTIMFFILMEKIPFLQFLFPQFIVFFFVALIVAIPLSASLGWWHMRRSRVYRTESILASISNPLTVYANRVYMDGTIEIFKKLKIKPSKEWLDLYAFWKKHEEKMGWKV